ncbi:hypothetical protein CEXT_641071 [Caerostris extrusa]|uniref:Transposase n=1 Tax=Caerostris extrusa TaxID=172846 RepID=A0AAV4MWK9_CAEEX|nr:hypothetical protein CEXT_641071 [Caerostris extrusa]
MTETSGIVLRHAANRKSKTVLFFDESCLPAIPGQLLWSHPQNLTLFLAEQIRNPLASSQRGTMDVRDWRHQAPRPLSRTQGNSFVTSPSAVLFRN